MTTTTNSVLAYQWYVDNNWYGERYRLIFRGFDGLGFKTKTEASKFKSLLKKYVKKTRRITDGFFEINAYENLETYRYCGAGPSWSCKNIEINLEEFNRFVLQENNAKIERKNQLLYFKKSR